MFTDMGMLRCLLAGVPADAIKTKLAAKETNIKWKRKF